MNPAIESPALQDGSRQHGRYALMLRAQARPEGQPWTEVVVLNISPTGCLIAVDSAWDTQLPFALRLSPDQPPFAQSIVVWKNDGLLGCQFERRLPEAQLSSLKLRGLPAQAAADTGPGQEPPAGLDQQSPAGLGQRIRKFRLDRKLSAAALADRLDVSRPTLWAWETGQSQPRKSNVARIEQVIGAASDGSSVSLPDPEGLEGMEDTVRAYKDALARAIGLDAQNIRIQIAF